MLRHASGPMHHQHPWVASLGPSPRTPTVRCSWPDGDRCLGRQISVTILNRIRTEHGEVGFSSFLSLYLSLQYQLRNDRLRLMSEMAGAAAAEDGGGARDGGGSARAGGSSARHGSTGGGGAADAGSGVVPV